MRVGVAAVAVLLLLFLGPSSGFPMGLWSKCRPDSATQKVEASDDASTSSTLSPADVNENGLEDAFFPQQQRFWQGGEYELLGSGIRYYKLGFIHVKVYGLALYVEREAASAELARLTSEGFFADGNYGVERMCGAIAQLKCDKVAQIQLLRSITASQFTGALAKSLRPRLADTDDKRLIPGFEQYFESKSLCTSTNVPLLWTDKGQLEADLLAPGQGDFTGIRPGLTLPSPRFCGALFDIWLRADTPVTGAREQWAASLQQMMNVSTAK